MARLALKIAYEPAQQNFSVIQPSYSYFCQGCQVCEVCICQGKFPVIRAVEIKAEI